jgi:formylglycine-generating enzyme required for sulfatase activity
MATGSMLAADGATDVPPTRPDGGAGDSGEAFGSTDAEAATDAHASAADSAAADSSPADADADAACSPGMVAIPARNQSFSMGFTASEAPGNAGGPWSCIVGQHQVTFTYDFCMDAKMVTQTDFAATMGFNPSKHQIPGEALPVDSETWYDAVLYCNAKSVAEGLTSAYSYGAVTYSGKEGASSVSNIANVAIDLTKNGYRLPTNAEYEYAERAGTTGLYFFSPTQTADITTLGAVYAWYSGNTGGMTTEPSAVYSGPTGSQPVGLKKPNPWGLYDIIGDLFEWEHDWEGPYALVPEVDPTGPATGTEPKPASQCGTFNTNPNQRMAKGGSWHTDVGTHMHISYHFEWPPEAVHPELGFRCVRTAN